MAGVNRKSVEGESFILLEMEVIVSSREQP